MLTRRAIRIKVMQVLYGFGQDSESSYPLLEKKLNRSLHDTYRLFLYCLSATNFCIQYIREGVEIKINKHIQLETDQVHNTSLVDSPIFQALKNDKFLTQILKKEKVVFNSEDSMEKLIFKELTQSSRYLSHLTKQPLGKNDHLKMLQFIFREVIAEHDTFQENVEEKFINWTDDKQLINRQMHETLRAYQKIANQDIKSNNSPIQAIQIENELSKFANDLLFKSLNNDEELKSIIKPRLKNWEEDRVAAVDLILLRMGVCEMLYFQDIPIKVTLNEYIELSKMYSTPKSHEFVNGILDTVVKELQKEGKIKKTGRGLM